MLLCVTRDIFSCLLYSLIYKKCHLSGNKSISSNEKERFPWLTPYTNGTSIICNHTIPLYIPIHTKTYLCSNSGFVTFFGQHTAFFMEANSICTMYTALEVYNRGDYQLNGGSCNNGY